MTPEDGSATRDTWIGGWYDSQLRKEDGAWKFARIDLTLKLFSPADSAFLGDPDRALVSRLERVPT